MGSENLARRFLHVNLNCASLDATERVYGEVLGLSVRMRTDPKIATDGTILGLDGETFCETAFLYDARGGRGGCALEAIEYTTPALSRDPSTDPVRPGIRSTLLTVADLDAAVTMLRDGGVTVSAAVDGLISGTKAVLVVDPDGAVIEITQVPSEKPGALFSGIRIAAIDAVKTGEFLTAIGFTEVEAPALAKIAAEQLAPGGSPDPVECVVSRYTLAEDAHQFSVSVVSHPDTRRGDPVPWGGNRQGLYRCALRVENVHDALAQVPDSVERMGDPVWCPLPGTKIEGLHIAFLRSPDGVVFEFVERPLSFFTR
ncbi:VOC family protein [Mycobacterium sp. AZCC_0083]|uniref:VOC family protein n=1 Tax=Mycobacterium sp. AZCC_0083 TaxID=2735882 RepID=UPI0016188E2D|nr:VOC family protein [Mycobacterium sp. AZCC_0083]MBB5160659.1 catechol 2,3-dioxygenase-like lactoylglutathione lyase family enzyme [Mycobacterium sp. AZCC_0083]